MNMPWYLIAALVGCSGAHENGEATAPPPPPAAHELPTEAAAAQAVLDEMNEWCQAQGDECDVVERPTEHPDQRSNGEAGGWISSHRERLSALGVEVVWDFPRRRFVSQVELDLEHIIGGMFEADHIGPEPYEEILARARARAPLYLGTLVERMVPRMSPNTLSQEDATNAIRLLRDVAPEEAITASRALLPVHRAALEAPPEDEYQEYRLRQRIAALTRFAAGEAE